MADVRILLNRVVGNARRRRQLQHGCILAFAQAGNQYDLAVGEFQGVVMRIGTPLIDLSESGDLVSKLTHLHTRQAAITMVPLHPFFECQFGAG
jgi:hypothetical protein